MTSFTSRFLEKIRRNLKSDAVPRPPRLDPDKNEVTEENHDPSEKEDAASEEAEEILIEENDENTDNNDINGTNTNFKNKKRNGFKDSKPKNENTDPNKPVTVNTQATGHVINIINSKGAHWGNNYVYHMGSKKTPANADSEDETIEKDDLITLLLEATEEVETEYMDYISKNLGKKWRGFFTSLGYTRGRIETVEYDEMKNGVSEVRFKLLLDYVRNADDPSLGHLANALWAEGEREVVKGLSIIYKKNYKLNK